MKEKEGSSIWLGDRRTLYFIRHGEALHNILEKKARAEAKEHAIAQGHAPDSQETLRRMEEARQAVLNNESLLDAPLSDMGKQEAERARQTIETLIHDKGFPAPTEVLVSPLERALETANIVFPEQSNVRIRVREEVRERLTGQACDSTTSALKLRMRRSFRRFSMKRQMNLSFRKKLANFWQSRRGSSAATEENGDSAETMEDKFELRERTRKLFVLIAESNAEVLAVVTHKGFLRELERGPFHNEDATEFSNGEVRVYRAHFVGRTTELINTERLA